MLRFQKHPLKKSLKRLLGLTSKRLLLHLMIMVELTDIPFPTFGTTFLLPCFVFLFLFSFPCSWKQIQAENAAYQEQVIELESSQEELLEQIASDISQRSDTQEQTLMLLELIYEAINEDPDQPPESEYPQSLSDPPETTELPEAAPDLSAEDQK